MLNYLADVSANTSAVEEVTSSAYEAFRGIINVIFPVFIGVILVLGLFFGVQLAVKYARAEDEDKKKKAKENLINVVVGCLIAMVFVVIIMLVLNGGYIKSLFGEGVGSYSTVVNTAS